jgi:hypothetical protein
MPNSLLASRVEILETTVDALATLPARMTSLEDRLTSLESQVGALSGDLNSLRAEVRGGDEETRNQMRILHEDVISRLALLQEGLAHLDLPAGAKGPRKPRRRDRS